MDNQETKQAGGLTFKQFLCDNSLLVNCLMLSLIFMANCFLPFFSYVAFVYVAVAIVLSNIKNALSYIFFALPFGGLNMPISVILYLLCAIIFFVKFILIRVIKEKNTFKLSKKTIIVLCLLLAYFLIPFPKNYNINLLIKLLCVFVFMFVLFLVIKFPDDIRLKFNLRVLGLGVLISSVFFAFRPISHHLQNIIPLFYISNHIIRFTGLFFNPNILGLICEICACILAYYIIARRANKKDVFTFIIFLTLGILTFSKAFMVITAIIMFFMFICAVKTKSKQAWCCIAACAVVGIIILISVPEFILVYLNRFNFGAGDSGDTGELMNAITTNRFDLWKLYLNYLLTNPIYLIFGRGLGASLLTDFSTHNMYLGLAYQLGVVGTLILVLAFVLIGIDAKKHKVKEQNAGENQKISRAIFIPILCIALLALIEDFIFYIA